MPTIQQFKSMLGVALLVAVVFTSIMLYRTNEIDPHLDATYAEIYGMEEE